MGILLLLLFWNGNSETKKKKRSEKERDFHTQMNVDPAMVIDRSAFEIKQL